MKNDTIFPSILATTALISLAVSIFMGLLGALYLIPSASIFFEDLGLTLQHLRPLHTAFVISWIFIAGIAIIYNFIIENRKSTKNLNFEKRFWIQSSLWWMAGIGIFVDLLMGNFSGREYIGHSPIFSLVILTGWLFFGRNILPTLLKGFWSRPVYCYMWVVGFFLFIFTYLEAHSWLLPLVNNYPIVDLQMQWKSMGAFVGAFNLLVYGSLLYVSEKMTGNKKYAQSKLAFSLFGIGLLNTFTNYVHHTYHLPQNEISKWISFIVSMLEIIIFFRIIFEIMADIKSSKHSISTSVPAIFFKAAKFWTGVNLFLSIAISIPPLNSVIHGTRVVFAHAMGSMIGIDTLILLGVIAWLIEQKSSLASTKRMEYFIKAFHFSLGGIIFGMTILGTATGYHRYMQTAAPDWVEKGFYFVIPFFGTCLTILLLWLSINWIIKLTSFFWPFKKRRPDYNYAL